MIEDRLMTALSTMAKSFGKNFTSLKEAINALPEKFTSALQTQTRVLVDAINAQKPTTVAVTLDLSELKDDLAPLRDLQMPSPTDMSNVEAGMKVLHMDSEETHKLLKAVAEGQSKLVTALTGIKINVPDTMKLDKMQLAAITNTGGGSAVATLDVATRVENTTVSIANASTEASYDFPSGTVGWIIKTRDQGTLGYYSWTTGKLPSSGDGTTYMTIPQNFLRSQQNVEYSGKTIYLGAEQAATIEIEIFRR